MRVFEIPVSARPQYFTIALSGVLYRWRLYWLVPAQCWVVDISDESGNQLICGIPLVTGADLLSQFTEILNGQMAVVSDQMPPDIVPDFTHLGITGHVYYLPLEQT